MASKGSSSVASPPHQKGTQKHNRPSHVAEATLPPDALKAPVQPEWQDLPSRHRHFGNFVEKCFGATLDYLRSKLDKTPEEAAKFSWLLGEPSVEDGQIQVKVVRGAGYLNLLINQGSEKANSVIGCINVIDGAWKLSAVITTTLSVSNTYLDTPIDSNYRVPRIRPMKPLYQEIVQQGGTGEHSK